MKERQREAATNAILEAAEEVAAKRGVENCSIAAIAQQAGVAVGTLYNYFPDRERLLAAWMQQRRDELAPKIEAAAIASAKLPFERRLRTFVAEILRIFEEKRQFIRVMAALDPKVSTHKEKQPPVIATLLTAFQDMLRPIAGDRTEEHARMLLGMVRGLAHWRAEQDLPVDTDAQLIADTFLKGIQKK